MSEALDVLQFPLHGSRLIEASAGTGKTFTLALLYARLVLGHGAPGTAYCRPLGPREILVVTFTEAATEELRDRIRRRLVEAADYFQAPPTRAEPGPLHDLRADYPPKQWPGCAYRLRMAAEAMDDAVISTIHGWCNRMLLCYAFGTRGAFNRELVSDQTDLLAEVVRDYWRVHFYGVTPAEATAVLEAYASPTALQGRLQALLRRAGGLSYRGAKLQAGSLQCALAASVAWRAAQQELQALEQHARQLWQRHWPELEALLLALRPHLNGTRHRSTSEENFAGELTLLKGWAWGADLDANKLQNYAQGRFSFKKSARIQQEAAHPALRALADRFDREQQQAQRYAEPQPPLATSILAHALGWVEAELAARLQQRAELGFDDLLTQLDRALDPHLAGAHGERLADALRAEFPAAMIDEFQDTDPVQYRIFDRIYRVRDNAPATALIMIGDPKQAIYSFRGADIHTYLEARRATAGRHYTLTRNFRSTQGVVDACNRLFGFADEHPRGAFRFRVESDDPLPFVAVSAQGRPDRLSLDGQPAAPMTCWTLDLDGEDPLALGAYRERAAAHAASELVRWLAGAQRGSAGFGAQGVERPLRPADIAILVRTSTEAAAMREALAARHVNSVYLSDRESLFMQAEASDLLHWLRACAAPSDERLVRAALGTNILALPLARLAALQDDELAWEQAMQQFHELRQCWRRQGVLAMLRRLMEAFELPARLLQTTGGERLLTNLLHLAEWLQQASAALDGEQALIRHLAEHLGQEQEEHILRLESDAELVKIITIHKSKGLEYPLVLLPFICSWREVDGRINPVPYRADGEVLFESAGKKLFEQAWRAADDDRLSEDMRLLYVATTRARHALWLCVAAVKSGNAGKPQLHKSALGYVLGGGAPFAGTQAVAAALTALRGQTGAIAIAPAPVISTDVYTPAAGGALDPARCPPDLGLAPWWIASYSALRFGALADAATGDLTPDPGSAPAGPWGTPDTPAEAQALEEAEAAPAVLSTSAATAPVQGLLHELPRGSYYGTFLHGILEWAASQRWQDADGQWRHGFAAAAASARLREDMLARRCRLRGLQGWAEPLSAWLADFLTRPWRLTGLSDRHGGIPALTLAALAPQQVQVEMEFWLESHDVDVRTLDRLVCSCTLAGAPRPQAEDSTLNGLLKGFIDLVVEHGGRYYVVDWKSNWLGDDDDAYHPGAMRATMLEHRYDLQYALYLLALHRQLRARLPGYDYERHVGGAVYAFLRGSRSDSQGLFMDKPPLLLIERLDALFGGHGAHADALAPGAAR